MLDCKRQVFTRLSREQPNELIGSQLRHDTPIRNIIHRPPETRLHRLSWRTESGGHNRLGVSLSQYLDIPCATGRLADMFPQA